MFIFLSNLFLYYKYENSNFYLIFSLSLYMLIYTYLKESNFFKRPTQQQIERLKPCFVFNQTTYTVKHVYSDHSKKELTFIIKFIKIKDIETINE